MCVHSDTLAPFPFWGYFYTNRELKAEIICQLAIIKNNQGAVHEATKLYKYLIDSSDFEHLTYEQQAIIFHHMGVCYVRQGNYKEAEKVLKFCVDDKVTLNQNMVVDSSSERIRVGVFTAPLWEIQAYAWNQLGNIAMALGNSNTAQRSYQECLRLFTNNGEGDNLACIAYQSLGRLFVRQQKFVQAIPYLERGLAIRRHRDERDSVASNAVQLAEACIGIGHFNKAEQLLNEALRIYNKVDEPNGKATCYFAFGQLERKRGNSADAILQWKEALDTLSIAQMPPLELQILVALIPQLILVGQFHILMSVSIRICRNLWKYSLNPHVIYRLAIAYVIRPNLVRISGIL